MFLCTIARIARRDQCGYDALLAFGASVVAHTLANRDYVPLDCMVALNDEASLCEFVEHHLATICIEELCDLPPFVRRIALWKEGR